MNKQEIISSIIGVGFNKNFDQNSSITLLRVALYNPDLNYNNITREIYRLCGDVAFGKELEDFFKSHKVLRHNTINKMNSLCAKYY